MHFSTEFWGDEHVVDNYCQVIPLAVAAELEPVDFICASKCSLLRRACRGFPARYSISEATFSVTLGARRLNVPGFR